MQQRTNFHHIFVNFLLRFSTASKQGQSMLHGLM